MHDEQSTQEQSTQWQSPRGAFDKIEEVLLAAKENGEGEGVSLTHVSLGALSDGMQERAFGLLILLLALPCALPFIYGIPQMVALPMLVLVFQMASGRAAPWLPQTLRKRHLPIDGLLSVLAKTRHYAGWLERFAHPRIASFSSPFAQRIIGALLLVPCLSILVPLPLTNTVPGVAVGVTAVGLIQRDALFIVVGLIAGFLWVSLLVIGGPTLIYFLIEFLLNRKA